MTVIIPEIEPSTITAGLSSHWTINTPDSLPADWYALNYYLIKNNAQIVITGADNGDGAFLFEVTSVISAAYLEGEYSFKLVAILGDDKWEIRSGKITVLPDFIASTTGKDTRSHNKIMLENIQATLRRGSVKGEKSYSINGKSVERFTLEELEKMESKYKQKVFEEEQAERRKNGLRSSSTILASFKQ